MLALVLHEIGGSVVMEDWPEPTRQRGESIVEIKAAAVGHLDHSVATGSLGVHPELPYIPGVEAAGVVLESDTFPTDTAVIVRGAGIGVVSNGTWTQRLSVSDRALMPMPQGMDFSRAACFFVPVTTAFVAVHDICSVSSESTILVTGVRGAVGGLVAEMCVGLGARVIGMSRDVETALPPHLDGIELLDCDISRHITSLPQCDALIDTVAGSGFSTRLSYVNPGGIVALVGYAASDSVTLSVPQWILNDVTVVPVNMLNREQRAREVAEELARKLTTGELNMNVTGYEPSKIEHAREMVNRGQNNGRTVITFSAW